ncbi:MAG: DNA alkylation repair protein [Methanomassiliicoccales archaeon]|nr:DNA alkylation repair protein [Methanomassiliicoccales archaeon]
MTCDEIVRTMESKRSQANVEGMARFGIKGDKVLGLCMADITAIAKEIGKDHRLAQELWATGIYDARILAALVDEPKKVTREQMDRWALDFDNWGVCDCACMHLFDRASCAWEVVADWCRRDEEFVRRAGFAIIASLTIHDKKASDERFLALLPLVREASTDERPMVRKAVNWALRQIGKRNLELNRAAIAEAMVIRLLPSKSARRIASDALRELEGEKVQTRLKERAAKRKRRAA